jgi:hypothetical protein
MLVADGENQRSGGVGGPFCKLPFSFAGVNELAGVFDGIGCFRVGDSSGEVIVPATILSVLARLKTIPD